MNVAIIGGGAAGFFSAIQVKENFPEATVCIFEKSAKVLAKVKISGGGRCNVTNGEKSIKALSLAYPRGGKQLKKAFTIFSTKDTFNWFEKKGVPLVVQEDNCVFPQSQDSQSIIDCFMREIKRLDIHIVYKKQVQSIVNIGNELQLNFKESASSLFSKVIVATGGMPKKKGLDWLEIMGHKIETPVPSLFTFNMPNEKVVDLMGIVVENTIVRIQGTKLQANGPLLITHWGMSGPAILKLSAFGARILSDKEYSFNVQVNWVNITNQNIVMATLLEIVKEHPNKYLSSIKPYGLSTRFWNYLIEKTGLPTDRKWGETGKKGFHKIINVLTNDLYAVQGKTTFKEEFVTCGGVSLESIHFKTMESKAVKNLYFCGEIMDIDGITGGYNFQAAWTTAFIAGKLA